MSTVPHKDLSVNRLQEALQRKQTLYQNSYALTRHLCTAVEAGEGDLVLKLLKRREVIFHKIRDIDREIGFSPGEMERLGAIGQTAPEIASLWGQIRELILKLIALDGVLFQQMKSKRVEALNRLRQNRDKHRLAAVYRLTGSNNPRFIDSDQ